MDATKISLVVILIIVIGGVIFLNHIGFFSNISVEEKKMGPYVLVYEDHIGDYKGTKKIQDDIYEMLLDEYNIEANKGFAIYYDDPKKVAKEELKSIAGCILEKADYGSIQRLKDNNIKITETSNNQEYVVADFPMKNPISVLVGIMKVHPAIADHFEKNGYEQKPMMEIYDVPEKKIIYMMSK